jgi:hypothetical protein
LQPPESTVSVDGGALPEGGTLLTRTELTTARLFLQHAHASVLWVATLFFADGNTGGAARLNDVAARLMDEMADIDTLLKHVKP